MRLISSALWLPLINTSRLLETGSVRHRVSLPSFCSSDRRNLPSQAGRVQPRRELIVDRSLSCEQLKKGNTLSEEVLNRMRVNKA